MVLSCNSKGPKSVVENRYTLTKNLGSSPWSHVIRADGYCLAGRSIGSFWRTPLKTEGGRGADGSQCAKSYSAGRMDVLPKFLACSDPWLEQQSKHDFFLLLLSGKVKFSAKICHQSFRLKNATFNDNQENPVLKDYG